MITNLGEIVNKCQNGWEEPTLFTVEIEIKKTCSNTAQLVFNRL